ncbi:hypothetical protein QYF61_007137 [Mycteria americana]|uniref:Uncharacterized protein n=1 Tax=Mycteria americana TaxID=33587 RepID=A0AAN7NHV9_MYCAM|nr:hypothetical protein QYF61_007137 [Mycteria americana]
MQTTPCLVTMFEALTLSVSHTWVSAFEGGKGKCTDIGRKDKATQEDYRDAVCHCREKIIVAKARLEFKLNGTVKDNKMDF